MTRRVGYVMHHGKAQGGQAGQGGTARREHVPAAWFRAPAAAGLTIALLATSCADGESSKAPRPPPPHVVDVTMEEYRFEYDKDVPAGRVVFNVLNAGQVSHRLSLLPLAEDLPPIDVQLRGSERRIIEPFAGVNAVPPGQRSAFAVDLVSGVRYAMVCFLVDESDNESHALKGMTSEFRTREAVASTVSTSSLPAPSTSG